MFLKLSTAVLLVAVTSILPTTEAADPAVKADFRYTVQNGEATIIGYDGAEGIVSVPTTIAGLPVTRIGIYAFAGNSTFTQVEIPDGVVSIGLFAFGNSAHLASVVIPDTVSEIGSHAFYNCPALTNVVIPRSITKIGERAFQACSSLASIEVDALNNHYRSRDGVLFDKGLGTLIRCPSGRSGAYTIPRGVTIAEGAFGDCHLLTSVVIPDTITAIPFLAFHGCTGLSQISIPASVTSIGDLAFISCNALTAVRIPKEVSSIGRLAFSDCSGLRSIDVDAQNKSYSSVDGVLFDHGKTNVIQFPGGKAGDYTIPSTVTTLQGGAFNNATALTRIVIPPSVSMGAGTFGGCFSLKEIIVDPLHPDHRSVEGVLFDKNGLTLLQYPGGRPGTYRIPEGTTVIANGAFASAPLLIGVTIPDSVVTIGASAFQGCSSLATVAIPAQVSSIGGAAFTGCTKLKSITVDDRNSAYSSLEGVLFDKNQTKLLAYPSGRSGDYEVPSTVESIEWTAFYECPELTSVVIPASVINVRGGAFYSCKKLRAVFAQGDHPGSDLGLGLSPFFDYGSHPTLYYLPGRKGWESVPGGSVAPWHPRLIVGGTPVAFPENQFYFAVAWAPGQTVVVEAATRLTEPVWTPIQTNTLAGFQSEFTDPQTTNHPIRFYRLQTP